jgi:hypothetical protein
MVLWVGLVGMALLSLAVAIESVTTVGIFGADLVLQGSVNSGFIRLLERILPANSTKVVSRAVAGHEPTVADLNDFIGLERPNILVLSMDSHMDMKNGAASDAIAESIEQFVVAGLLSEPPPKLFITGPIHLEECESENDVNFDYTNAQLENLALQYKVSFIHLRPLVRLSGIENPEALRFGHLLYTGGTALTPSGHKALARTIAISLQIEGSNLLGSSPVDAWAREELAAFSNKARERSEADKILQQQAKLATAEAIVGANF